MLQEFVVKYIIVLESKKDSSGSNQLIINDIIMHNNDEQMTLASTLMIIFSPVKRKDEVMELISIMYSIVVQSIVMQKTDI